MIARPDPSFATGIDDHNCSIPVQLGLLCGVRRYVALACRASYEDARNRRRGHIIASESFGLGEVPYRLIGKRFPNQVLSGFAVYQALGPR
jgi:hypothetical protein